MTAARLLYWTVLAWVLILVCFFFMPPPNPNAGLTPVNINYVWGLNDAARADLGARLDWVIGMMVLMPILFFLPVHYPVQRVHAEGAVEATVLMYPRHAASDPSLRPLASGRGHGSASRLALPLRFALRDLRGGLRGFYVFIACIALGVMAIAGVNSFASSLGDGLAREGRAILGGDLSFTLSQREADAAERAFLDRAGPRLRRRHHARDGAHTERRPHRAGRDQGGRRRLSAVRRGAARSGDAARRRARRSATASSAPPPIRCCWRGSTSSPARASPSATPPSRSAPRSPPSPTSFRRRLRLRAAADDQPGGAARHRPAPARAAWCAGTTALRLPDNDASDAAVQRVTDAASAQVAGCRLGGPQPQQRLARARAQHRALHPISHAGRPHRAAGRRRRRRQRDPRPSRPQARHHRHHEVARRHRRRRVRDLSHAGDGAGADRRDSRASSSAPRCRS